MLLLKSHSLRPPAGSSLELGSRAFALLWFAFALLWGCGTAQPPVRTSPQTPPQTSPAEEVSGDDHVIDVEMGPPAPGSLGARSEDFLHAIRGEEDWEHLYYRPEYQNASRTEVVKVVIDLQRDWRLYFINSLRHELHFGFVQRFIDPSQDHAAFNIREYRRQDRRFVCLSVVHYLDANLWSIEQAASDILDTQRLSRAIGIVRDSFRIEGADLRYRPLSPTQEGHLAHSEIPAFDSAALRAQIRYQSLVNGVAFGRLRFVRGELDIASVSPTDLLVTEYVPDELPPVAALITARLQAPLAHVAILSRNRGTPDMALRDALSQPELIALEGEMVRLEVGPQDFSIARASAAEAEAHFARIRPQPTELAEPDRSIEGLIPTCSLRARDVRFAGAKASQLGEICALGIPNPGGFVIPFVHYQNHFQRSRASGLLDRFSSERFQTEGEVRAEVLGEMRARMERYRVDPIVLRTVVQRLRGSGRAWIFRSSTNAEDLPGFNGAGLYRSVIVRPPMSERAVEDAIREVWASVWLQRAFEERDWHRIDHRRVAMSVLIQPLVESIEANGVAITRNPNDQARPGVFVNLQVSGGANVTAGGNDRIPEQLMIYTWAEENEPEVITRSSETGGRPILTQDEMRELGDILSQIHDAMTPSYTDGSNAVDVEFMVTGGANRFVVVQARPIQVTYRPGQTYR